MSTNDTWTIDAFQKGISQAPKTKGKDMLTIVFKNTRTKATASTYLVDGMENVGNWDDVIDNCSIGTRVRNLESKVTSTDKLVIDADSHPTVVEGPATSFHKLFDSGE